MSSKRRKELIDELKSTDEVVKKQAKYSEVLEIICNICKSCVMLFRTCKSSTCPGCGNTIKNPEYVKVNPYAEDTDD